MHTWIVRFRPGRVVAALGLAALALTAVILTLEPITAATSAGNWGLSFQKEGQPPVGNVSAQALAAYDAFYIGDTTQKVLYLTFDAGYENGYTAQILDTLKKHNAPATFFVVGHYIETAPELLRRMAEEGHLVGNHTYHHYDMSKIGDMPSFQAEMTAVEQAYEKTVGQPMPRLYRPPQGKYSEQNLKMAQQLGYRTYFWSLAYVDWYVDNQPTKEQAFAKLLPRVHNGAIILLHSTSATNAQILDELLTRFEEMGYRFGKLTDLSAQSTGA